MSHAPTVGSVHAFTVDVEEYFHVNAFDSLIDPSAWEAMPSRVVASTDRLLDLLAAGDATGTFFVLGWVAVRHPELVRRIAAAGHEVACHGFSHQRVTSLTPATFEQDVRRAKDVLEDIVGAAVNGYRAPSFSIIRETEWALDILRRVGFTFDSSRFPIARRGYGSPHVDPRVHVVETPSGPLLEVPLSFLSLGRRRVPSAGGGWFRQFPKALSRIALRQYAQRGQSGVFYIHPWEIDPEQPRLAVPWITRMRHYRGLDSTEAGIEQLLTSFRFASVREIYASELRDIGSRAVFVT